MKDTIEKKKFIETSIEMEVIICNLIQGYPYLSIDHAKFGQ
jgi:hypothetical protein